MCDHEREALVHRICSVYPHVPVEEQLGTPHNRVDLGEPDPVRRVARGKRTLVLGAIEPKRAVWDGGGRDARYANRRRLSVYGFCFYGCRFCYLAGRSAVWFSPTVKIFVNLQEILAEAARQVRAAPGPLEFCLGELQDGLSLDPLTAYSTVLIRFFARQPRTRLEVRTKSVAVERLLALDHRGRTALSWTLNPPEIARVFEPGAPDIEARIEAMRRCAQSGYPVRAALMPVIPLADGACPDWEKLYLEFARNLLSQVPLERLTLGGISMDARTKLLLEARAGAENAISHNLKQQRLTGEERTYYPAELCKELFRQIAKVGQKMQPNLSVEVAIP